ncbi:hypothetical protein HKX42_07955 [Salinisphaera sp. USBA-960]|nr:hypothetical protein [Salifodinibacter halophilus]NNC26805.1 hypothetical protein [Salifodinibacter halophilus]
MKTKTSKLDKLKKQLDHLQAEIHSLKKAQRRGKPSADATTDTAEIEDGGSQQHSRPNKTLTLGGSATVEYEKKQSALDNTAGGSASFGRVVFNAQGQYKRWSFGLEQRFYNFENGDIFHYGWAARDFGAADQHRFKAGFYQVPFGNLRYGFYGFWGSLAHFTGYTNNQAAGVGYRYERGPWRFDADVFKNDDAGQHATYGTNPSGGYERINGLNLRTAYTTGARDGDHATFSFAARGGRLSVGAHEAGGHRFALTAGAAGDYGPWGFQAQIVQFNFDVPDGQRFEGTSLPTDSVAIEHYGFPSRLPARGQIYGLNIARRLPALGGDDVSFKLYNDAGYLHSDEGEFDAAGQRIGDTAFNVTGLAVHHGPLFVWLEGIAGRNAGLAGIGPNDGNWHWQANVTFGLFFEGEIDAAL